MRVPLLGAWNLGLFASYNDGKHTLPDTYNVGVTVDYFLDQSRDDMDLIRGGNCKEPVTDKMLAFVATPAVYMPQVLAIPDNLTVQNCAIALIQYLGAPNTDPGLPLTFAPFTFSFAPLFAGSNIVYSLAVTASNGGLTSDFSINPNSGLLSYTGSNTGGTYNLTITDPTPVVLLLSVSFIAM